MSQENNKKTKITIQEDLTSLQVDFLLAASKAAKSETLKTFFEATIKLVQNNLLKQPKKENYFKNNFDQKGLEKPEKDILNDAINFFSLISEAESYIEGKREFAADMEKLGKAYENLTKQFDAINRNIKNLNKKNNEQETGHNLLNLEDPFLPLLQERVGQIISHQNGSLLEKKRLEVMDSVEESHNALNSLLLSLANQPNTKREGLIKLIKENEKRLVLKKECLKTSINEYSKNVSEVINAISRHASLTKLKLGQQLSETIKDGISNAFSDTETKLQAASKCKALIEKIRNNHIQLKKLSELNNTCEIKSSELSPFKARFSQICKRIDKLSEQACNLYGQSHAAIKEAKQKTSKAMDNIWPELHRQTTEQFDGMIKDEIQIIQTKYQIPQESTQMIETLEERIELLNLKASILESPAFKKLENYSQNHKLKKEAIKTYISNIIKAKDLNTLLKAVKDNPEGENHKIKVRDNTGFGFYTIFSFGKSRSTCETYIKQIECIAMQRGKEKNILPNQLYTAAYKH